MASEPVAERRRRPSPQAESELTPDPPRAGRAPQFDVLAVIRPRRDSIRRLLVEKHWHRDDGRPPPPDAAAERAGRVAEMRRMTDADAGRCGRAADCGAGSVSASALPCVCLNHSAASARHDNVPIAGLRLAPQYDGGAAAQGGAGRAAGGPHCPRRRWQEIWGTRLVTRARWRRRRRRRRRLPRRLGVSGRPCDRPRRRGRLSPAALAVAAASKCAEFRVRAHQGPQPVRPGPSAPAPRRGRLGFGVGWASLNHPPSPPP